MTPNGNQRSNVISPTAWGIAGCVLVVVFSGLSMLLWSREDAPAPLRILIPSVVAAALGGWALLVGYINGDARRRGMRYVMWTWLAALLPDGIGIILYFVLRDPLPVYCTKCGGTSRPTFAFCPRCGNSLAPACPQCKRVSQADWSHCAYCGSTL